MNKFKFKMNEHNDVIHVFIDNREKPVDSIHFMEHNDRGQDITSIIAPAGEKTRHLTHSQSIFLNLFILFPLHF
jgi:hypothetical protein